MRWWLAALLLAVTGCRCGDVTAPARGALRFSPPSFDFAEVYERARPSRAVELTLDATFSCEVTLVASAPFSVAVERLTLGAGTPAVVEIELSPGRLGPVSGTLLANGCGLRAELPLRATVVAALSCPAGTACEDFAFDADQGVCRRTPRPDGTACSSPCLLSAQCVGGVCRGQAKTCDDGEECTADVCLDDGSCEHLPAQGTCPAPASCVQTCDGGVCPLLVAWRGPSIDPTTTSVSPSSSRETRSSGWSAR
ncbi:MAG: hypothetical protein AB1938_11080 [Myxococcota bacterium]